MSPPLSPPAHHLPLAIAHCIYIPSSSPSLPSITLWFHPTLSPNYPTPRSQHHHHIYLHHHHHRWRENPWTTDTIISKRTPPYNDRFIIFEWFRIINDSIFVIDFAHRSMQAYICKWLKLKGDLCSFYSSSLCFHVYSFRVPNHISLFNAIIKKKKNGKGKIIILGVWIYLANHVYVAFCCIFCLINGCFYFWDLSILG